MCITRIACLPFLLVLSSCDLVIPSYNYELTLVFDVSGQEYRGSGIVRVDSRMTYSFNGHGVEEKRIGQAPFVKIGDGMYVFASSSGGPHWSYSVNRWLSKPYGLTYDFQTDAVKRLSLKRGAQQLNLDELPQLILFKDLSDPASAVRVDPEDLSSSAGIAGNLVEADVEITEKPVSRGISQILPWLSRNDQELNRAWPCTDVFCITKSDLESGVS